MPTIEFKGKAVVNSHHLSVPIAELKVNARKSCTSKGRDCSLDENLIIHGDNLHALKALLPWYAGRIDWIYIDPPYNKGTEGWSYNDNVNSAYLQEWFEDIKPIDGEDLERHDKWLCMMWPRLNLLRDLLKDTGAIFISIDDNERHHLRMAMDEIFGESNFVCDFIIRSNPRGSQSSNLIAKEHEYMLLYAKEIEHLHIEGFNKTPEEQREYDKVDENGCKYRHLGLRQRGGEWRKEQRPHLHYPIFIDPKSGMTSIKQNSRFSERVIPIRPTTDELGRWTWSKKEAKDNSHLLVGKEVRRKKELVWDVFRRDYLYDLHGKIAKSKPRTVWLDKDLNYQKGKRDVKDLLGEQWDDFEYPKPIHLVKRAIGMFGKKDGIFLDSFAGSGSSGEAVLRLNNEDGGNRKFILVECEDYAEDLTARRIRKVIRGAKSSPDVEKQSGIDADFTYCTLGKEMNAISMLDGTNLPDFSTLASYLVFTASGTAPTKIGKRAINGQLVPFYEVDDRLYYLLYKQNQEYLLSTDSALDIEKARRITKQCEGKNKDAVVYATHKFVSQDDLSKLRISFCGLPWVGNL